MRSTKNVTAPTKAHLTKVTDKYIADGWAFEDEPIMVGGKWMVTMVKFFEPDIDKDAL